MKLKQLNDDEILALAKLNEVGAGAALIKLLEEEVKKRRQDLEESPKSTHYRTGHNRPVNGPRPPTESVEHSNDCHGTGVHAALAAQRAGSGRLGQ